VNQRRRKVAQVLSSMVGTEVKRKERGNLIASRAFLPRGRESGTEVSGGRWRPVTGSEAYFGFLVSGHAEEGEENTSV
jgi:hypothetical protein